ncbi:MAG TPA: hypothetical protein VMB25_08995 [Bryobacteraceae bacterium]|nr:hypothetical protein [Bryobacteraceae bacterium]
MSFSKLSLVALAAATCFAAETRFWQQGDRTDFESGSLTNLSLESDGRIFLAPELAETFDSATPYLWSVVADSKGNLYTAGGGSGGGTAKIFQIEPNGKTRTFAELDGLEIHALAFDSQEQLYAATDPDGKIYKISSAGKASLFYDPHQKYIWAMAFNRQGDLFVATGDQGEVDRVTPAGSGSVFFKTEETHARSLAIDGEGNLIVGTEPSGLILRISPKGQGFVLYQAPKREITTVSVGADGAIWAAGVGNKTAVVQAAPAPASISAPEPVTAQLGSGTQIIIAAHPVPQSAPSPAGPSVAGGSDLYRINPDGAPRKIWANPVDIVYAITFDSQGRPLLGTGNRGKIYRIDSDTLSTLLLDATPTQVTGFGRDRKGDLYAVTGNIGKVFRIGPGFAKQGTFDSQVLDAGSFAYWGRISYRGSGTVSVSTRSGNQSHPENNWSPWASVQAESAPAACDSCGGGRATSPSARFLQYKIEMTSSAAAPAPEVNYIEVAYLPKNIAPQVEQIEVTPPNYRFPAPVLSISPSTSITLAPMGQSRSSSAPLLESGTSSSMNYAKGFVGVRWAATDSNGDGLIYKVEIRGVRETGWSLLKDNVKDRYLSWDSTAFPDGEYVVRVTASDSPSNPPAEALTSALVSDPFLIDNTPPQILNLNGTASGNKIEVRWTARDASSNIDRAEYSVNGGEWLLVAPVGRLSDSLEEQYDLSIDRASPGQQVIAVRVTDEFDNQSVSKAVIQ